MLKNELIEPLILNLNDLVINYKRKNPIIGIYKITYESKIYVGQGSDIENRFWDYKRLRCEGQPLLYRSLKKYGVENHLFEIIHVLDVSNLAKPEIICALNELEIYYIETLNSFIDNNKNGLNLMRGGNNIGLSEQTKDKIRKTLTGRKIDLTDEQRLKKSLDMKGENNPMFGKHGELHNRYGINNTPEHTAKIVAKNTGKKQSEEHREKNRLGHIGLTWTEERKKKQGEDRRGKNNPNFGKPSPRKGIKMTEEEKLNRKKPTTERPPIKDETRKKQSVAHLGKKLTPESIVKREETKKTKREERLRMGIVPEKRIVSLETREKQSKLMMGRYKGRKNSEEQNRNHRITMTGRKQSTETVAKRAESIRRNKQERLTMIF